MGRAIYDFFWSDFADWYDKFQHRMVTNTLGTINIWFLLYHKRKGDELPFYRLSLFLGILKLVKLGCTNTRMRQKLLYHSQYSCMFSTLYWGYCILLCPLSLKNFGRLDLYMLNMHKNLAHTFLTIHVLQGLFSSKGPLITAPWPTCNLPRNDETVKHFEIMQTLVVLMPPLFPLSHLGKQKYLI